LDGRHACYLAYSQPLNVLYLVGDDGSTLLPGSVLNSSGSTANSQCTVSWTAAPVTQDSILYLTLTIALSPTFTGDKIIYLAARDLAGDNSGWKLEGLWQRPAVAPTTTTSVIGMNPPNGVFPIFTGNFFASMTSTFSFSDTNGYQDLGVVNILIDSGTGIDGRHACYLAYVPRFNDLYLVNDAGTALLPVGHLNSASGSPSLGNSQCVVTWTANPVSASGNRLDLTLTIHFSNFQPQVFYLAARDLNESNNTGWLPMGIATFTFL